MKTSPAFQFYPKDYLGDLKVNAMSLAEQGAYWRLCCHCWLEGSIPDDPVELASVVGAKEEEFADWWGRIRRCFRASKKGRLVHPRMQLEKKMQKKRQKLRAEAGKKGAEKTNIQRKLRGNADKVPSAKVASSSSSSSSTPVLKNLEEKNPSSRELQFSQVETCERTNRNSPRNGVPESYTHWQTLDGVVHHRAYTGKMAKANKARAKAGWTEDALIPCLSRYAELAAVGKAPGYGEWGYDQVLSRDEGVWLDRLADPNWQGLAPRNKSPSLEERNNEHARRFLEGDLRT